MPIYHTLGQIPRKRHIAFRQPDGGLYAEELMGHEGFTGTSSLLYHTHPPTTVKIGATAARDRSYEADPDQTLRHRHFRTSQVKKGGSPTLDRIPLLFNQDIAMLYVEPDENDAHFYRNAQADELVYVAKGTGTLETVFGDLPYRRGRLPRDPPRHHAPVAARPVAASRPSCWSWRAAATCAGPSGTATSSASSSKARPTASVTSAARASLRTHDERGDFRILVKQYDGLNEIILDHHPFDVVGWDGYFYPWAFNIHDFEPIVGRVHQPPPVHQTFQGDGFVVCSFCPRPYDFHPEAVPAPYNHSNVDSDEVLYYASSEFMSRKGIEFGSITHHPDGIPHGPHPGRAEASIGAKYTDELAVMMDSFRPLKVAKQATSIEDPDYHKCWLDAQHAQFNPPTT